MPYRLAPGDKRAVQVKKGQVWRLLKKHQTKRAAKAHLTTLKMNVHK